MELSGTIIQVLPLQSGEGKNGVWKKQEFILETEGQYPKKVCLSMWGDKIDDNMIKVGNVVKASIEVESREYNSRWYTDVKAWRMELASAASAAPAAGDSPVAMEIPASLAGEDDLPF